MASGIIYVSLSLGDRVVIEYPLVPNLTSQSITETVVVTIGYGGAFIGLLFLYYYRLKLRRGIGLNALLVIAGVSILIVSFLLLETLRTLKRAP